jgi:hypothetical protein
MKATDKQFEAAALYCAIMEETKLRHGCVRALMSGETGVEPVFIREFCFLQFRMICELIALGCLVAHGDIKATQSKQVRTLWSAAVIVEKLEGLHPDFFPIPFVPKTIGPTERHLGIGPAQALTKDGLLALYGKCGGALHRGSRAKLLAGKIPKQTNFPDIGDWANALQALLDNHIVLMLGGQTVFVCEMGAGPNGAVRTSIGVAPGPSIFVPPDRKSHPS